MVNLEKVKKYVADIPGAKLIRLKEVWVYGKGYVQMPRPSVIQTHLVSDIEQMVAVAINLDATYFAFEINVGNELTTADFTINEVTTYV